MLTGIEKSFIRDDSGLMNMLLNFNNEINPSLNFSDVLSQLQVYQDNLMKSNQESSSQIVTQISQEDYNNQFNSMISCNENMHNSDNNIENKTNEDENHQVNSSNQNKETEDTDNENANIENAINSTTEGSLENELLVLDDAEVDDIIEKLSNLLNEDDLQNILKTKSDVNDLKDLVASLDSSDKQKLQDLISKLDAEGIQQDEIEKLLAKLNDLLSKTELETKVAAKNTVKSINETLQHQEQKEEVKIVVEDNRSKKAEVTEKVQSMSDKSDKSLQDNKDVSLSKSDDEPLKKTVNDLYREQDNNSDVKKNVVVEQTIENNKTAENKDMLKETLDKNDSIEVSDKEKVHSNAEIINVGKNLSSSNSETSTHKTGSAFSETSPKVENIASNNNNSANANNSQLFNDFSKGQNAEHTSEKMPDHLNHLFKDNLNNLKKMEAFQELVKEAKMLVGDKVTEMQMKLSPKELGNVEIKISVDEEGNLNARIITSNTEAKTLIESNIAELKTNFVEQGLNVQGFEVSVNQEKTEQDNRHYSDGRNKNSRRGIKAENVDETGINKTAERLYEKYWEGKSTISLIA